MQYHTKLPAEWPVSQTMIPAIVESMRSWAVSSTADVAKACPTPVVLRCLSQMSGFLASNKFYGVCQKVTLPPLIYPCHFHKSVGPGVFQRLRLTNHFPFPNSGVTYDSVGVYVL
jgi:hypothetical protein